MIEIKKAALKDLEQILEIYDIARKFMRENGNETQWADGYPSEEQIRMDIKQGNCYLEIVNEKPEAVFVFIEGEDPSYTHIHDGQWPNDLPYGTIHRLASRGRQTGAAEKCFSYCWDRCRNLRADTHQDNKIMQHLLEKNGFAACGIIYVADGSERKAYQRTEGGK